jgi:energy-coupling factor transport system permease protein
MSEAAPGQSAPHASTAASSCPGGGLDVRIRLLIVVATSVTVLLVDHPLSLGVLCVAGRVYLAPLRRFRVQFICYAALGVLGALSVLFLYVLQIFMPMMRSAGWSDMLVPLLRMLAMLHVVLALALSMRLCDVLGLLKQLRLPRSLYLPLAVTIRFITGLIDDVRQIRDCLRLRGYRGLSLLRPRLFLLPLVFRSLHLSDELGISAELKGIGYGRPVTPEKRPAWNTAGILAVTLLAVLTLGTVWVDQRLSNATPATSDGVRSGHSNARPEEPTNRPHKGGGRVQP